MKTLVDQLKRQAVIYKDLPSNNKINNAQTLLGETALSLSIMQNSLDGLESRYIYGIRTHYQENNNGYHILCPICKHIVANENDKKDTWPKHCSECGTKLIYQEV